jgi:hypothetical protein
MKRFPLFTPGSGSTLQRFCLLNRTRLNFYLLAVSTREYREHPVSAIWGKKTQGISKKDLFTLCGIRLRPSLSGSGFANGDQAFFSGVGTKP